MQEAIKVNVVQFLCACRSLFGKYVVVVLTRMIKGFFNSIHAFTCVHRRWNARTGLHLPRFD